MIALIDMTNGNVLASLDDYVQPSFDDKDQSLYEKVSDQGPV